MDNRYFLPRIAPHQYEAFRNLMGDEICPTHAEWTEFMSKRHHEEAPRHEVVDIDADPNEFARYVGPTGKHDIGALQRFITEKAHGRRY